MKSGLKILLASAAFASLAACGGHDKKEAPPAPAVVSYDNCQTELLATGGQNAKAIGGQCVKSPNGDYALKFGTDGNIILAQKNGTEEKTLWQSDTGGGTAANPRHFAVQVDGNFVMIEGEKVLWNSQSNGKQGSYKLTVSDDGHASIAQIGADGMPKAPVWSKP